MYIQVTLFYQNFTSYLYIHNCNFIWNSKYSPQSKDSRAEAHRTGLMQSVVKVPDIVFLVWADKNNPELTKMALCQRKNIFFWACFLRRFYQNLLIFHPFYFWEEKRRAEYEYEQSGIAPLYCSVGRTL